MTYLLATTWPQAVMWGTISLAAAIAYAAFRFTGGDTQGTDTQGTERERDGEGMGTRGTR